MHTERDIRIGQLFKEFRDWRADSELTNEQFLADLKEKSGHFRRLIEPIGGSRLEVFAKRARSLDTSTVWPLLLFLASIEGKPGASEEVDQAIIDLESFMIRRFICDLTPKNYNRFFLSVLVKAKKAHSEGQSVAGAIRDELLRSLEVTARWPDDEEFARGWRWKDLYVRSRPDRAVMILSALEHAMRSNKNERVTIDGGLTVEHLLPQKGSLEDYPYATTEEYERLEGQTPQEARDANLHVPGNLTLLTGSLNASVSNGPWPEKVEKIVEDSDLRINAWLRSSASAKWDEASIRDRSNELFEYAKQVWPIAPGHEKARIKFDI